MSEERAIIHVEPDNIDLAPRMVMSTQQALARLKEFQDFVSAVMVRGTDYGQIPGIEKPCLLKPGAEKLCEIYALTPEIEVTNRVEDWQNGFFHYECSCTLRNRRTGLVQATGVGSCNSKEKRYSDRWVFANEIPNGVDKDSLQSREFTSKKGGSFKKYLWKNEDIFTLVNTILKMAKKRALVDATLSATRSSGMFTQDVEDWVERDAAAPAEPASNGSHSQPAKPDSATILRTRWEQLWQEAKALGLKPEALKFPCSDKVLIERGQELAKQIAQAKAKTSEAEALDRAVVEADAETLPEEIF